MHVINRCCSKNKNSGSIINVALDSFIWTQAKHRELVRQSKQQLNKAQSEAQQAFQKVAVFFQLGRTKYIYFLRSFK